MRIVSTPEMICVRWTLRLPLVLTVLEGRAWWGWGAWERRVEVGRG